MSRHYTDKTGRSQEYTKNPPSLPVQVPARSRRNPEQQQHILFRHDLDSNATHLKLTLFILTVALILTGIAFFSTNWLEVEQRYYGSKFKRLGLWRVCFNSFSAPDDFQFKKFYVGCRWLFSDEYKPIRSFLLPGTLE